ncbi:alpha/beta-hydrolase family protein [Rhodospirillaceae bacterium SYSU D60014]|uniref:alpha/beta hydrolase n=1 Tax=Virgifigura deserti TaxID=2268457 RepID=UPI000E65F488
MKHWPLGLWRSLSGTGLLLGTLFFAASLTPTLVPRTYITQGVLGGSVFAVGYGLGVFWRWLWSYMELPTFRERALRTANLVIAVFCAATAAAFLWRTAEWQNSIRTLMELDPVTSGHPIKLCAVAVATFLILLGLARLFTLVFRLVAGRTRRFVPRRVANVIGTAAAVLLFWSLASDVFFNVALRVFDSSARQYDALIEPTSPQPRSTLRAGGPASLLRWEQLGRAGREFIASGPSAHDISAVSGRDAMEPIRVYVGLRSAETPEQRAKLALEELKRTGAFDRSMLIVITPTGSGWVDPAAMDGVEYLHGGDVASVAMQYSYLASPVSFLVQPGYGEEAARALFSQVYGYWRTLPKDRRPKLYLFGLSLGAMNSERSTDLFEIFEDPIQGALWSGPPFTSRLWRRVTDGRNAGSPAWLPQFRDGSLFRFMNQNGAPEQTGSSWGSMRIVYLQYASDAVTFFDYRDFYRRPDWMVPPRGPDVSSELRWYPVVTMLQLALDTVMASTTPIGYGHVYAPAHYLEAWLTLTDAKGWSPDRIAKLRAHLTKAAAASAAAPEDDEEPYANRGG